MLSVRIMCVVILVSRVADSRPVVEFSQNYMFNTNTTTSCKENKDFTSRAACDWFENISTRDINSNMKCSICKVMLSLVDKIIAANKSINEIKPFAQKVCIKILTADGMKGEILCPDIIEAYTRVYMFVFANVVFQPEQVCIDLRLCPAPESMQIHLLHDLINVPPLENVPIPARPSHRSSKTRDSQGLIKVAMISDVHIEYQYAQGASTQCGLYGCCQTRFPGTGSAGSWGDYSCDIPMKTMRFVGDYISKLSPKPDFMIYGGDSPSHHIGSETWQEQLQQDEAFNDYLVSTFKNWTIYSVLGNHESYPNTCYYEKGAAYESMTAKFAQWWSKLFNMTSSQAATIKQSAYYTALVRPGLRLLVFNSDYWLLLNPYFLLNDQVPAYAEQLRFMNNVLQDARKNKEKVILAAHGPATDVLKTSLSYGAVYTDLVSRYTDVIVLQLFGHTHNNQFALIIHPLTKKPVAVQHVTGSVTTFTGINPSFTIYHLDNTTFELVDYDSYYFDIQQANGLFVMYEVEEGKPEMKLQYSARRDFQLDDLSAESFYNLTQRFVTDEKMLTTYVKASFSQSPSWKSCDQMCRKDIRCRAGAVMFATYNACMYAAPQ